MKYNEMEQSGIEFKKLATCLCISALSLLSCTTGVMFLGMLHI